MARLGATPGCSGCVGLGLHTEACRVRLEKALADEKASASRSGWDRSQSLPLSLSNQHKRRRLHHPVLLRRCQHKTFRTSSWIHRWSWEHKNAESARERGQTRRHQVKSLRDQWYKRGQRHHQRSYRRRKAQAPVFFLLQHRPGTR